MDNARNNDTASSHLGSALEEIDIEFDARESRLRFLGHVINFVVKVLLYGSGMEHDMDLLTGCIQQEIR